MLLRSLPYWVVPVLLFAAPPAGSRGEDPSPTPAPKAASAAKLADDPAATEAFKKAGIYKFCQHDKDGNVISVSCGWHMQLEKPADREIRLECLEHLKGFPQLRKIETITDYPDQELGYIAKLTKLETLEVLHTELSDAGLAAIEGMPGLKRLSLDGNRNVTDTGLEHLAGLKSLEDLVLAHTDVRGTGLAILKDLKNLKRLDLTGSRLSDAEMANVAALTALEELDLSYTKITSGSVGELSRLTHLRSLRLLVTGITASNVEGLKKSLPKLEIKLPSTYVAKPTPPDPRVEAMMKAMEEMERNAPKRRPFKPSGSSDPQPLGEQ